MNIHHNARLTPLGRERMVRAIVEGGQTPQAAARAAGVCPRTARKWVDRFKAEGRRRTGRPLIAPAAPATADEPGRRRSGDRACAAGASTGQQIAKAAGRLAGDRQPHPQARSASAASGDLEPRRAGAPLQRRSPQADRHRHQRALPLQPDPPHHHRQSAENKGRQLGWRRRRLGICPRRHRQCLAPRLLPRILPNKKKNSDEQLSSHRQW